MSLPNFQLRTPGDSSERKVIADVKEFGWHVVHIPEDDEGPGYSFTVGLYYTYQHPELLVMGLDRTLAHQLLTVAEKEIAKGTVFADDTFTNLLLENHACKFRRIGQEHYPSYLGLANWFYRVLDGTYPALQILWPDKSGRFPGEQGFNADLARVQTRL